ncbi:ninjurin-A isoform X2 [Halyomorpha halys]|uniref:ninjurin-A isoform X2 n=1 Tax=Halyomorpha halys TaxID=286706 RepID=UPI0006D4FFC8|nr:ninjurin-2-like isoform X2 [Halyomorpha halys]
MSTPIILKNSNSTNMNEEDSTGSSSKDKGQSYGRYAAKKTVAQGMMDLALITANANQLRYVIQYQSSSPTYYFVFTLIVISILLQIAVGICLIFKGRFDLKGDEKRIQANAINNYVIVGVFLVTVINVFIAAFSIGPEAAPPNTTTL